MYLLRFALTRSTFAKLRRVFGSDLSHRSAKAELKPDSIISMSALGQSHEGLDRLYNIIAGPLQDQSDGQYLR